MIDYLVFEGFDCIELYINDDGKMEFCQENDSKIVLSDEQVVDLAAMCIGYLRMKGVDISHVGTQD